MATQPIPNTAQVDMKYLVNGEGVENVYHVLSDDGWNASTLSDLADVMTTWENAAPNSNRSAACSLIEVICTDLTSLDAARFVKAVNPPIAGQLVSDALPNNATFAVKANIGSRGRGRSGRSFWVGLAESQIDLGHMDTASADDIVIAMNDLIDAIVAGSSAWTLVVAHRVADGVPLPVGTTSPILAYSYSDLSIDSQRDRLPNHKRHRRTP